MAIEPHLVASPLQSGRLTLRQALGIETGKGLPQFVTTGQDVPPGASSLQDLQAQSLEQSPLGGGEAAALLIVVGRQERISLCPGTAPATPAVAVEPHGSGPNKAAIAAGDAVAIADAVATASRTALGAPVEAGP